MKRFYSILFATLCAVATYAQQIVTTSPSPLQQGSSDVVITYHAELGNQGLMGLSSSTAVYAHVGAITNKSNGQWAYAPTWLNNASKYKLTYTGPNTYTLAMGNMRSYFGITDPTEVIEQLAFVFRTSDASKTGRTATGGDIFVDVLPDGFQLDFTSNAPFVLSDASATVTFTAQTTQPAKIELYLAGNSQPFASATSDTKLVTTYTFAQGAQTTVTARATAGSESAEQSIDICYPANSQPVAYPGGGTPKMGAIRNTDGSVTFCLAAPGKSNAMIVGAWTDYKATAASVMNYADVDGIRYFWTQVSGLAADTQYPYYYLVDSDIKVGDPYARLVLDPYNDKWLSDGTYPGLIPYPSDKVDGNVMLAVYDANIDTYAWKVTDFAAPAKEDLIIYELLVRDFTGTEGKADGNGTINGALDKLPYLKELGVNAIELMPICEFSGNNSWGYNTNFYFAPDKAYGSPTDYRRFIDACHQNGIAVILDVVFNQSDGLHPWYQLYPQNSNPFYNVRAPHAYSVLNDWNQDNLLVQQQWKDMLAYWLTAYKIDGFRFDLVKGLGDNSSYGGNASEANTNKYNASRVARMKELTDAMHAINPNAYSINENLATAQEENDMAANGQLNWANINNASCQFAMGYQSDSDLNRFYAPDDSRTWGSTVSYAESHDEQRMAYKQDQWGVTGVKGNLAASMTRLGSVAAQMLLAPGPHMIWQFGELGNATNTKNTDGSNNTDPKPVLWSYFDNADRHGLYDSYKELIAIRRSQPALFASKASFAINCAQANWAGGRTIYASADGLELICAINPNTSAITLKDVKFAQPSATYHVLSASYGTQPRFNPADGTVALEAGAYCVLVNDKLYTGLDPEAAAEAARPVAVGSSIQVVGGPYTTLAVYDAAGRAAGTTSLAPGLYIAIVDGTPHKLIVKP